MGPWIASKDGSFTNYTTIQDAINAAFAASPTATDQHTVYVKAGTYTENITLYPYVNLVGADGFWSDDGDNPVVLNGNITLASGSVSSVCYISNITVNLSTSFFFNSTVTAINFDINFKNCKIKSTSHPIFSFGMMDNVAISAWFNSCQIRSTSDMLFTTTGGAVTGSSILFVIKEQSYVAIQIPQLDAGNVIDWQIDIRESQIASFPIDNDNGESAQVFAQYSTYIGNVSSGSNFVGEFFYCDFNNGISFNVSTPSAVRLLKCNIGEINVTSPFTYASYCPITLTDCTYSDTSGYKLVNKYTTQYPFSENLKTISQTSTADATPTVIYSVPIPASMSAWVRVGVAGTNSAHTDTTGGDISAIVQCTGAAMTIVNQDRNIGASSSGDVTLVTNFGAGTLDITVTGIAATTYYWTCTVEWQKISTST
jgi:hypothetical protein